MGQRSQIVLITPPVFYNKDNPNNDNGKVYAFHNQWRYGQTAMIVLSDVLKKLDILIKEAKQDKAKSDKAYFKNTLADKLLNCIRYAENHRIEWNLSQTHTGLNYELTEALKSGGGMGSIYSFLEDNTDNNNGWFIIKVDHKLKVSISILNGTEDDPEIKQRTPEEYLKLFGERDKFTETEDALKHLKTIKKHKLFYELRELKLELNCPNLIKEGVNARWIKPQLNQI